MRDNDENKVTYFAQTDSRNKKVPFGIKQKDRSRHMYIIGKTGMGKSTLLENMAVQDIKNGEGLAFIDPHGKTADLLLDYVPKERMKDVLYFAPFDMDFPVSFNVMEDVGVERRHLVANGLMSAFKKIWVDAWSARMEYILNNILLALLEFPEATLIGVNRMLADKDYRKKVVDNISDPSVKAFWTEEFAKYGERYMQEAGAAIQNKIGQFISNPVVRNIIGQPKSTFDLRYIMDSKKIVIINLSKGRVGEANANLLGSMLITKIYLAAMSRADTQERELQKLPNFYLYVDEFQSFANESFADILSEARKYKLNLIMAHQYIEQMTDEVRAAVFGNVGSMIVFRVGAYDADVLEKEFAPQFTVEDLVNLGFVQIYLKLMIDGVTSPPFSATTLPPIALPEHSLKDEIIGYSRESFAQPRAKVEEDIKRWHLPLGMSPRPQELPRDSRDSRDAREIREPREAVREPGREARRDGQGEQARESGRVDNRVQNRERSAPPPQKNLEPERGRSSPQERPRREERNEREPIRPRQNDGRDVSSVLARELDLRKAVSLNQLKPPEVKKEKKEQTEKNVSALREALSSIMKGSGREGELPPRKEANIGTSDVKSAPPPPPPPQSEPVRHERAKTAEAYGKSKEKKLDMKKPAELPEDVLRKILHVDEKM
ncbi:MAG: DUF87 domain-containing protein [Candidatus Taylorbacteria bacterium]